MLDAEPDDGVTVYGSGDEGAEDPSVSSCDCLNEAMRDELSDHPQPSRVEAQPDSSKEKWIRPVTIRQALSAQQAHREAKFAIDGVPIQHYVGIVTFVSRCYT